MAHKGTGAHVGILTRKWLQLTFQAGWAGYPHLPTQTVNPYGITPVPSTRASTSVDNLPLGAIFSETSLKEPPITPHIGVDKSR